MKRTLLLLAVAAITFLGSGCSERIDAGHVGLKVNLYGSEKGVSDVTMVTGRVWYNPLTTEIHEWPTFMQNAVWTADVREGSESDESITFQTNEGLEVRANVALNYAFEADKVPRIFQEFRKAPAALQATYLRTQVRNIFVNAASRYSIEDFIERKSEFLAEVERQAQEKLGPEGFIIDTLTFVGSPRYPRSVVQSIENKIAATQIAEQKQRELQQANADAAKIEAAARGEANARIEEARGEAESMKLKAIAEAEAIRKINNSLTPEYVSYLRAQRWDGKYPGVLAGNDAGLLLDARP